jgi:peptide-methionine (S)-S-oxide reductase
MNQISALLAGSVAVISLLSCGQTPDTFTMSKDDLPVTPSAAPAGRELATFGAGCFWCVEAVFQSLQGVDSAVSGYSGGQVKKPSYKEVCTGRTGHAEVVQITFDPGVISFVELLVVFFSVHDPTTLNRQGGDVGTQYRSAVFYHSEAQKEEAERFIGELNAGGSWPDPVVTEVTPFANFYAAEDYHQDYFNLNGEQPYCQMVVRPKVEKFRKQYGDRLKAAP